MSSTPNTPSPLPPATRREFLKAGSGAALTAMMAQPSLGSVFVEGSDTIRVGLIGCGGRGTGAAFNALKADPGARLVAMGDTFADAVASSRKSLQESEEVSAQVTVSDEHCFAGFDAYQKVIEQSDVVLLVTPPHFRPQHLRAALEAGKHVFCEKPIAVDAPGVRHVLESGKLATEKKLSVVTGLCYRYHYAKRETMKRIHEGAIGDIVALETSYNIGGLWHRGRQPEWSDMEWQVRNWLYFTWLSGDHIVEQHIHSLDKIAWAMGSYPVKCTASGGRIVRTEEQWGNIYDHFNTTFEWENGVRGYSSCRQWNNAVADVSDHVFGTKGRCTVQAHEITGENEWRWRSEEPDDMYQNEHDELFRAVRSGEPINDCEIMSHSTLMAIMARMSAYTGQSITWDQALNSQESLTPKAYEWGELAVAPIARPGITEFV